MKDRVTYESQALYVGPTGTGVFGGEVISGLIPTELQRIQSLEHYVDTNLVEVYQQGSLNSLGKLIPQPPEVNLEFTYILGDAQNEKWLGLNINSLNTPAIANFISGIHSEQNFYLVTKNRGDIATTQSATSFLEQKGLAVYGFGNGAIERYTMDASLIDVPTATVEVSASNMTFASGASGIESPAVTLSGCRTSDKITIPPARQTSLEVDALRPAYITLNFDTNTLEGGGPVLPGNSAEDTLSSCSLESFSLNLDLERRNSLTIGNRYTALKKIDFPTDVTLDCTAKVKDVVSGNLMDVFCSGSRDILIQMDNPNNSSGNMKVAIKDAHLQTQVFAHTLLGNETVDLTFNASLSAPDVSSSGFYMSGVAASPQETTYGITEQQLLLNQLATR